MKRAIALTTFLLLSGACAQPAPAARTSPSPGASPAASPSAIPTATPSASSPSPSPTAAAHTSPYGVLATNPGGPSYTISIVGGDGRVAATVDAATRSGLRCTVGQGAGTVLPSETLSATGDRVYYLDGNATVRWLAVDGSRGSAGEVPGGGTIGSTFAVSPDDRRIAVVTADYSQAPVPYRIYVEDLGGGNRTQIFSASSNTQVPWAMGWHAGQLVLGYAVPCSQGGGPFSGFPSEIHLVDAATAVRSATLGGPDCRVESLPAPSGVICKDLQNAFHLVGWDGRTLATPVFGPDEYFALALSPGGLAAACCDPAGDVLGWGFATPLKVPGGAQSLGFIDDSHLLLGGETAQRQARVIVTAGGGDNLPVNALGEFLARLPGGL